MSIANMQYRLLLSVRAGWPDPTLIPQVSEIEHGLRTHLDKTARVARVDAVLARNNPARYDLEINARYDLAAVKLAVVRTVQGLPTVIEAQAHVQLFLSSPQGYTSGVVAPLPRD